MSKQRVINRGPVVAVDQDIRDVKLELGALDAILQIGWRVLDFGLHTKLDLNTVELAGIIVGEHAHDLESRFIGLSDSNVPIVSVGPFLPEKFKIGSVVKRDFPATGVLVSSYFVEKGIRQIGYLMHDPPGPNVPIFEAMEADAKAHGAECHVFKYSGRFSDMVDADPEGPFAGWLKATPKPMGIFCGSDRIGAQLCRVILDLGWSIPDDIAVLGMGNERFPCEVSPVPLSSVDCNDPERGRVAVGVVADMYSGRKDFPRRILVPPKGVVERRSTGSDSLTLRVLAFMHDNLQVGLTIEDIASEFQVSRRTIERAIKEDRGETVLEVLRSMQFQRCCDLLTTTDISVDTITSLIGFSSKEYLQRIFRKEFGVSLSKYRAIHRTV